MYETIKGDERMITIQHLNEVFQIINGEHADPHRILGMHEVEEKGKHFLVVRAFIPGARSITVVDAATRKKKYPMKRIHEDGFFEVVIAERAEWFRYRLECSDEVGNSWHMYDPYSFSPTVTEYDRYLFGAGTHYRIYEKLGAHLMTFEGARGVAFAVWAPNAKSVSVIGSFNGWNTRRHPMRLLGTSGIWELFIPGLAALDQYKFHIVQSTGHQVDKCDPYAFYAQLRPETASVIFPIRRYQWKDRKWMTARKKKDVYASAMNIYEVHLGSWMRVPEEGNRFLTYTELAEKLVPYVKEMGFSHIELLPVEEHPFDGSWGYQVTGYYAPTSRYGTPAMFKAFIDACHSHGIGVILDWVPAHFPKDAFGLGRFDGTALYEHQDPRRGEHLQWGTYIFNYGRKEVSNFLLANALFWLEEYHIDGLRVDAVASMLYLDFGKNDGEWAPNAYGGRENLEAVEFLKHMNSVISKQVPGAMMIAEESTAWEGVTRPVEENGLGSTMKWNMGWMNDFLSYIKKDPIYRKYHHNHLTFGMAYHYSEHFVLVLSHDEVVHEKSAMIGKMPGDLWQKYANLRLSYGFMYAHPGKKLLFMGGEFAQFHEWNEAQSLDWHLLQYQDHQQMQRYMKALNHLYLSESAFWEMDDNPEGFTWIECDDAASSVVSFIRRSQEKELYVICNFTPEVYPDFRVGVPEAGRYQEIFNSDAPQFGGSGVQNQKPVCSEKMPWNRYENSIRIQVPPLGMTILEKVINQPRNKQQKQKRKTGETSR